MKLRLLDISLYEYKATLKNYKAFTLIEVMVAVSILGLVMLPLFSGFRSFLLSSYTIKNEVQLMEDFQDAVRRIQLDLEQLCILPWEQYVKPDSAMEDHDPFRFIGSLESFGGIENSSLVFSSFAHARLGKHERPGVARIVYYLRSNLKDGYDLCRSDVLYPFPERERFCYDPVLSIGISRFKAVFIDKNGNEHLTWDSDSLENEYSFPISIRFTIGLGKPLDGKREYTFCVPLIARRFVNAKH